MDSQEKKCVIVLDEDLPLGLAANTAAILGLTLGRELPEVVGADVTDGDGRRHLGIIEFPIPVLKAPPEAVGALREALYAPEYRGLTVVDFSDLAQGCKTYGEYMAKMAQTEGGTLTYFGLALCGDKKRVNRLTGSLPLLR